MAYRKMMASRTTLDEDQQPGLRKPQFSLIGLFWCVSVLIALLATFKMAGPLFGAVVLLLALALLAHVAGNALGTQLRDSTGGRRVSKNPAQPRRAEPHHFAATTRLAERVGMGWPMLVLTALCGACGAYFGGGYLAELNAAQANKANITLAFVSCGVLGAILGFGLSMFLKVTLEALWHAHRHD